MGPSHPSSEHHTLSPRPFPPYKPTEEYEKEQEEEEDVGLLSATSGHLQHIASRTKLPVLFGSNKSCRRPRPPGAQLQSRRSKWCCTKLLVVPFSVVPSVFLFLGAAFVIGGVIGYYYAASGISHAQAQDDIRDSCRSMAAERGGEGKVLKFPLAGEVNGLVPEFEIKHVVFGKELLATTSTSDYSMNSTSEDEEEERWKSYMPAGKGFIAVDNSSQYNTTLPQPIEFQDQTVYSISVFHQLHCLHTIMQAYNSLSEPNTSTSTTTKTTTKSPPHTPNINHLPSQQDTHHQPSQSRPKPDHIHSKNHINHCFRYLRQSLICCGDTALEGQDLHHPELKATNGEGAVHLCKDYEALKGWAEGRRVI